jgi:hypothetical protein
MACRSWTGAKGSVSRFSLEAGTGPRHNTLRRAPIQGQVVQNIRLARTSNVHGYLLHRLHYRLPAAVSQRIINEIWGMEKFSQGFKKNLLANMLAFLKGPGLMIR